ncbi:MAG: AzlD domain-containing protein [Gammaproteobacteria bacterium]|uniref:branched-chain amino acid transporter permease n=1 Tax=Rhodoferax sp. TaxID=50421 RepID=UPI0017A604F3|nr:AzlD domain-containing protein [Rhodoferax sp.]MBU3899851.1 AzlD domain-containing protein [Gammaproteobacteria bacterium]MBA3058614.1 AzlD domain-containing protein [Rhodoferax sp.]MBU3996034.1 AzlD domain-containing protein [Gammaproteobacteria bacterium]MBU4019116.1 AzlD domain-containing protein [Gammaproteobacteria bacterium]MBU4078834.1 AzlD domain-containing protein [Gammaproteobacteria bacterium]
MIDTTYALGVLAAMAIVTFGLRALPFLAARWLQSHPLVQRLGRFLPLAIMALLLLHTLVGSARQNPTGPWAELVAVATVLALQWWRRQALLSILAGTALYVLLRNPGLLT